MSIEEMQKSLYISNYNKGKVDMIDEVIEDFIYDDKEVYSKKEILKILSFHKDYNFNCFINGSDIRKK